MSLNFGGINIGGTSGGGGSTANYIPGGTIYEVKADGSGDFATVEEAVSHLTNKISDGSVTLSLGAGTYSIANSLDFYIQNCNIGAIILKGAGVNNTTLSFTADTGYSAIRAQGLNLSVEDLTLERPNVDVTSNQRAAFVCEYNALMKLKNITINHVGIGVISTLGGKVMIESGTIAINTCKWAFNCVGAQISSNWQPTISINTADIAFRTDSGGMINLFSPTINYTSVTTKASQTPGSATSGGWITGFTI